LHFLKLYALYISKWKIRFSLYVYQKEGELKAELNQVKTRRLLQNVGFLPDLTKFSQKIILHLYN